MAIKEVRNDQRSQPAPRAVEEKKREEPEPPKKVEAKDKEDDQGRRRITEA